MIKIFVGTMFSGENEFVESQHSLSAQLDLEVDRYFVCNSREIDAHRELYGKWNSVKHEYDCFVQLDPDVILHMPTGLKTAYVELEKAVTNGYTSIQYPLNDHLTDKWIYGLNMY